jgi:hypothetical protein
MEPQALPLREALVALRPALHPEDRRAHPEALVLLVELRVLKRRGLMEEHLAQA